MSKERNFQLEVEEYDNYKTKPLPNTPENRRQAAAAREKALILALELKKKNGRELQ